MKKKTELFSYQLNEKSKQLYSLRKSLSKERTYYLAFNINFTASKKNNDITRRVVVVMFIYFFIFFPK
jgi:hypothetical protein